MSELVCPYCGLKVASYVGLCRHIMRYKKHGDVSQEQLLTDMKYNGIRPKCACGCGEYTSICYDGGAHFHKYVSGHHNRVHNNWGHNPKAIINSANTRRRQYAMKERTPWNKGNGWGKTFSSEKIEELMKIYKNKERNEKISKKLKGVPKSEEHAKKCREIGRKLENIQKNRERMYKNIKSGRFVISSQLEKDFIEKYVKPLNVEYITQYYLKDIHQYCDVYIPSKKLVLECDGSFWHCDPRIYPSGPQYKSQKNKLEKDKIKDEYLKNNGYQLLRCLEFDILNNQEKVKEDISKFFQ